MSGPQLDPLRKRLVVVSVATMALALGLAGYVALRFRGDDASRLARPPIVVSSDLLDFGELPLDAAIIRQLVLRNDGPQALSARLSIQGSKYTVRPEKLILHPGVEARVEVAADPARQGSLRDNLHIEVADADLAPLVIGLLGHERTEPIRPLMPNRPSPRDLTQSAPAPSDLRAEADAAGVVTTPSYETTGTMIARVPTDGAHPFAGTAKAGPPANLRGPQTHPPAGSAGTDEAGDPELPTRGLSSRGSIGVEVNPAGVPLPTMPFTVADGGTPPPTELTQADVASAAPIGGSAPNVEDLVDGRLEPGEEPVEDTFADEEAEEDGPFNAPQFQISSLSRVSFMGSSVSFYPQNIPLVGSSLGGTIGLGQSIEFPKVLLAMGESMLFSQASLASGRFDAGSGTIDIEMAMNAIDSDGGTAPIAMKLTTGTVVARTEGGVVVSLSGTPRQDGSGMLKLVGMQPIPVGHGNSGARHLVIVELLASMDFGTSLEQPNPLGRPSSQRRIGG